MKYISISDEIGRYFRVRRLTDDKTALLGRDGHIVIDFGAYTLCWSFHAGGMKVAKNKLFGLMDSELNLILPCEYKAMFACCDEPYNNCYGLRKTDDKPFSFYKSGVGIIHVNKTIGRSNRSTRILRTITFQPECISNE